MKNIHKVDMNISLDVSNADKYFRFTPGVFKAIRYLQTQQLNSGTELDLSALSDRERHAFSEAASVFKRGIPVEGVKEDRLKFHDSSKVFFFLNKTNLSDYLKDLSFDLVICDSLVFKFWGNILSDFTPLFFICDEKNKGVDALCNFLYENKVSLQENQSVLIVGGGVMLDAFGFLGSRWKWQLNFVPTTLLAQVDAAHGGKNSLNIEGVGKNLIGSFYSARSILCCVEFLESISELEWKSGCVEALKHALLMNDIHLTKAVLDLMARRDIDQLYKFLPALVEFKRRIVSMDSSDQGLRNVLNFGHTIGHGLEALSLYNSQEKIIPHGLAVLVGMYFECKLAKKSRQILDTTVCDFMEGVIESCDFFDHIYAQKILDYVRDSSEARNIFYKMIGEDKKNRMNQSEEIHITFSRFWNIQVSDTPFTWKISIQDFKRIFEEILSELVDVFKFRQNILPQN